MKTSIAILALSASVFGVSAMAADKTAAHPAKPTIALVHGAFEDAKVWQGVEAKLKADGYPVVAVDLPGRPGNPAAPDKVSLDLYRDTVIKALTKTKSPAVLVGHSFGGITISAVAEAAPKKVKTLVYVAAYLPRDGDSLVSMAGQDADAKIGPQLQIKKDQGIAVVNYAARADLFANDGSPQLRAAIPGLILDEPLAPLATPVHLTEARFGQVDKVYVHTAKDQVISPAYQARMVQATPVRSETTLQTGHTPFLTDPAGLTKAIEDAAR
ncbi:alpha/beta hydrolase [Bordetella genomosp. 8]|uniref:Alpha/beta hydrolase n=2 Tax=Bordetella genomosp. 8 TaxID=1416806 RepID=A0A1W6YMN8_9BORD|nr:alpha/beta hydrolase [Bordetella genomosp. 8]